MVNHIEAIMARRQIDALIRADPTPIRLKRRDRIDTPSGGWRWGPWTILPPQEVLMVPFKRRMTEYLIDTQEGFIPNLPYVVIGRYRLDIRRGDQFELNGEQYRVETLDLKRQIRIAAQVDYLGEENPDG